MVGDVANLSGKINRINPCDILSLKQIVKWQTKTVFLTVSRLIKLKGIDLLLTAWKRFQQSGNKDCALLIVGDGPERRLLEQLCINQSINDIFFAGLVEYDYIHLYYALSDIFVIPTPEDNWSLVVPEAMACGKPILCSRYNGCWPELVQEDFNGWVFDPLSTESIHESLIKCVRRQIGLRQWVLHQE